MEAFTQHRGKVAILNRANIDTDQIIPKQFLKSIKRTGYEDGLFFDWRFLEDGSPNPNFELNQKHNQGASILVAGNNFGCGSSREHAVWAVSQYGFKVILAPKKGDVPAFADIFFNNSIKNGLLCVSMSQEEISKLIKLVESNPGLEALVDLEKQNIEFQDKDKTSFHFEIDPSVKATLLAGLDEIGQTLQNATAISQFEKLHHEQKFW
ncbi:MAG: 3-isopropylmalate dehydratase small subunit [Deltaproteobacteria bacterium]|nr:3-isopropylmalate dehydratase small subunit [Deltaproteobacteria bacterium]